MSEPTAQELLDCAVELELLAKIAEQHIATLHASTYVLGATLNTAIHHLERGIAGIRACVEYDLPTEIGRKAIEETKA